MVWDRTPSIFMTRLYSFLWQDCMRQDCIHFYDKMAWDRTAFIFSDKIVWGRTASICLWQDGMRQGLRFIFYDKIVWGRDCIHFYDKMAWDRTAFIFMTRLFEAGLHPFLWQDGMRQGLRSFLWQDCLRQDCIHFYDKMAWDRTAFIFMTRWHETGLHSFLWQAIIRPVLIHFYIGNVIYTYIHIFMYIYIYFSEGMFTYFLWDFSALTECYFPPQNPSIDAQDNHFQKST